MVDLVARAKKEAATAARNAEAAVNAELAAAARADVYSEMNAKFGPFELMNEYSDATPGYFELLAAVKRNTGKEMSEFVKARMAEIANERMAA